MATTNIARGSTTAVTITLDSLASSTTAGRESTAIDDTSTKALDYYITGKIVYPNSAPGLWKRVLFFVSAYDGTNWSGSPGPAGTGDAGLTFDAGIDSTSTSYTPLGSVEMVQNKTRTFGPWSVANAFGGIIPVKFVVIALNYSNQTLGSGCAVYYTAVTATTA